MSRGYEALFRYYRWFVIFLDKDRGLVVWRGGDATSNARQRRKTTGTGRLARSRPRTCRSVSFTHSPLFSALHSFRIGFKCAVFYSQLTLAPRRVTILETIVNLVYLVRLCRPGSEERIQYLAMAAKLLEEQPRRTE